MDYITCPYNPEHKVRGTELGMHLRDCESFVTVKSANNRQTKQKTKWVAISLKREKEEEQRRLERDIESFDPQDPERLLQCPYDSNHQIRACRFPYHLIKCRKNHGGVANQLVTCPFNARHVLPRGQLSFHISRCDDKGCIEQDIADEKSMYKRDVSPSRWNSPPCNEDWDNDLQSEEKATFIWGTPSYAGPSTGTLMDPKNALGNNVRAPKSLPYVLPWKMNNQF
ncbi:gametocyte-specific factor 1-like isoform X2 [Ranitomeya variabilis]|uniref:gametocyte-specific factor 1-like isoform X2 n=1 Tax=Ranitomeya variabilis TaxID=490064 RepID=UPI0040566CA6